MPIYEFFCRKCSTQSSILVRSVAQPITVGCPVCGSGKLVRLISRFAYHKAMKTIHEESGEPQRFPSPDYYKDPRNIGRSTEKKFSEMGLDVPSQVHEMIQAAREGEMPESVKDL